ncbi:MAG TPA: hypothetical protein VJS43_13740 [Candidatus Acidoferrales bacterium]|nr:hypothetical protein [Candidatus Acidoferrales bacterium]
MLPSAKEVMQKIALAEAEEAEKQARMLAEAQAEKQALIDQLSKPSGMSDEQAIRRGVTIIDRAVRNRMTDVEVIRFPNQLCTDKGPFGQPPKHGIDIARYELVDAPHSEAAAAKAVDARPRQGLLVPADRTIVSQHGKDRCVLGVRRRSRQAVPCA